MAEKLRVLLFPFFATSHIEPFTDLTIRLVAAGPSDAVEATVAVTPANSLLERRRPRYGHTVVAVRVATYPFPAVEVLPEGVENLGKAAAGDAWRIDAAAMSDALTSPAQEALLRALSPDAIVTDAHFAWNVRLARELGVSCVAFSAIGAFSMLAMRHLQLALAGGDAAGVADGGDDDAVDRGRPPELIASRSPKSMNREGFRGSLHVTAVDMIACLVQA
ncbi:UDP-glycosyltransferase 79A2-like [Triticum dicoccoides]|uniref:UDP-glycosyltransferase 79A2-like n=1 Tax=Triticum dicoccoides TaxID=85692 RepID=UPI00189086E3|nr:UDP-glycosyltransferase 79A2-like [Triticum dicoccoides]